MLSLEPSVENLENVANITISNIFHSYAYEQTVKQKANTGAIELICNRYSVYGVYEETERP